MKEFLAQEKIDVLTTRTFKENGKYIIKVGSISAFKSKLDIDFKGKNFDIQYGDFSPYLRECNFYLQ